MTRVVIFRPGSANKQTALEAMIQTYKYLTANCGYQFVIVKGDTDEFHDPDLEMVSIPSWLWRPLPKTSWLRPSFQRLRQYRNIFAGSDAVVIPDPTISPVAATAMQACRELNIPVWLETSITLARVDDITTRKLAHRIARRRLKPIIESASGIIATVPKCMERYAELGLLTEGVPEKYTILGHPVDTAAFKPLKPTRPQGDSITIMTVARLVPEKGVIYILEALDPLLRANKNIVFKIVGKGPLRSFLLREISSRNLCDSVEIIDSVPHHDLPQLLSQADIFINHAIATSDWEEYFGVLNIEAMACELPCILTRCGGIPYVIREDGVARFVEERDIISLRNTVQEFIEDPGLRLSIGQKARDYVIRNYEVSLIARSYHQMIQATLTRHRELNEHHTS